VIKMARTQRGSLMPVGPICTFVFLARSSDIQFMRI
jgi:hypothetical protein